MLRKLMLGGVGLVIVVLALWSKGATVEVASRGLIGAHGECVASRVLIGAHGERSA